MADPRGVKLFLKGEALGLGGGSGLKRCGWSARLRARRPPADWECLQKANSRTVILSAAKDPRGRRVYVLSLGSFARLRMTVVCVCVNSSDFKERFGGSTSGHKAPPTEFEDTPKLGPYHVAVSGLVLARGRP